MSLLSLATTPLRFDVPPTPGCQVEAKPQEQILMVLDAKGCVQYCSNPAFFASSEDELWGTPVNTLISGLPLRERTPGYNVAYVRFAFGHPHPRWQRKTVKLGQAGDMPVDVFVRAIPVNRGYCLLVALCPVREQVKSLPVFRRQATSATRPRLHLFAGSQELVAEQGDCIPAPPPLREYAEELTTS